MKSLSWRLCASVVVAVLAAGMILNLWRPLYIVPPYMGATWLAYLLLGLVWLPVFGVCLFFKPSGQKRTPVLLLLLGILVTAASLCAGPALPASFWGAPIECQVISTTPPSIRYECRVDRMFVIDRYVVEGIIGLPFVWPVSHESINL